MQNFKKRKLDEEKVDIPVIRVIVLPLKEPGSLSSSYMVAKLSRKTREILDVKNTKSIFREEKVFLVPNPEVHSLKGYY